MSRSGARILVVEDDPSILLGVRMSLERERYEVGMAADGEVGLRRAREGQWDLIVLDVMLPRMNGYELLCSLRAEHDGTPVLLLSARTAAVDKIMGLDLGADDYVTKPFSVGELVRALEAGGPAGATLSPPREYPDRARVPVPRFDLLDRATYASMSVQFSRGCPYSCELCDVIEIFGRTPRVKSPEQVLAEVEALLALGWRGSLFFVDDNFVGNRRAVRRLLPEPEREQGARSADPENDLAEVGRGGHQPVRLGGVLEWQHAVDHRAQAVGGE